MENRERLSSRLGFILLSAGCAIGLGNVWRFPFITGMYGGALFVLIYLVFLVILGIPIMTMEFAVGRASQRSIATSFEVLEPKGSKWHIFGWFGMAGNYLLMMYYTVVAGWILYYLYYFASGKFVGLNAEQVGSVFGSHVGSAANCIIGMVIVCVIGFGICAMGLQSGVEKVTKVMMAALLVIMLVLAVRSVTLPGAGEGLKFYLIPNLDAVREHGLWTVVGNAMGQAFFTLSLGIGSMAIFGSYIGKERRLMGESINVVVLDTFVAITAGLIIFPACFAYNIEPGAGPPLIFITLPNVFSSMPMARLWGTLFFVFMSFAALSTVVAVFENIISFAIDKTGCSRTKAVVGNLIAMLILALPCALGFNVWSNIQTPFGDIQGLEDFIVSNNLLPIGSLIYLLFCVLKKGWGWDSFLAEADSGKGIRFPRLLKPYFKYVLPAIILVVLVFNYVDFFS